MKSKTITKPATAVSDRSGLKKKKKKKVRAGGVTTATPSKPTIESLRDRLAINPKVEAGQASTVPTKKSVPTKPVKSTKETETVAVAGTASVLVTPSQETAGPVSADKKATVFTDLHPWPFEKKFKAVIKRREWNGIVADIQKHSCAEMATENESLHTTVAALLDERDALKAKLEEMREFVLKTQRDFDARFN
jgi:hypothetical protein